MGRKEAVHKKHIRIGIAVGTPHGLMVSVIRNVDQKGLRELTAESAERAGPAPRAHGGARCEDRRRIFHRPESGQRRGVMGF
jgi:hypothetical protein